MSYILDALNKSEQERQQQQEPPSLQAAATEPGGRSSANWLLLIPALALLVAIGVFAGYQFSTKTAAPDDTPVATLPAQEAAPRQSPGAAETRVPAAPRTASQPTAVAGTGQDTVAATAFPATAEPAAKASTVPHLAELPWSFRSQVPDIDYSAHVYSENGGTGFVILNGSMRYEGNNLGAGLKVREILPGGVVLEYRGRQFRLEAMKSWRQR